MADRVPPLFQEASQLAGTLTGPTQRRHGIAPGIRVNQRLQRLNQLGVVLDQPLPSGSCTSDSLHGEGWLMKVRKGPIDGRAREARHTGDKGNPSSTQPFGSDGSDEVLLSLTQVGEQRSVFLLQ